MNKEENKTKHKKSLGKYFIFAGITLVLFSLIALLVYQIFDKSKDDFSEDDISVIYRQKLTYIANEKYLEYSHKTDDNVYVSHIGSFAYSNNKFVFSAKAESTYLVIYLSGSQLSSLDSSFNYFLNNYEDISSLNCDTYFYRECSQVTPTFDNLVNSYTVGSEKVIVDKYFTPVNETVLNYSISFLKDGKLNTRIGKYDSSREETNFENTILYSNVIEKNAFINVIVFY